MKTLKDFLRKENIVEEDSPDTNGDGWLSPEELHKHLDIQQRGKVDMGDYAAHILFHAHHPEYLAHVTEKFNDIQRRHASGQEVCENDPIIPHLKNNAALAATPFPMAEGRNAFTHDMDPPAILVMHRKSIRQFPNGQRVALYYVDKINKYVTVPYEEMSWAIEETIFEKLKNVKSNIVVEHLDGSTSEVTPDIAKQMIELHRKMNETNKMKMQDMLEASAKHFETIAKFSKE